MTTDMSCTYITGGVDDAVDDVVDHAKGVLPVPDSTWVLFRWAMVPT